MESEEEQKDEHQLRICCISDNTFFEYCSESNTFSKKSISQPLGEFFGFTNISKNSFLISGGQSDYISTNTTLLLELNESSLTTRPLKSMFDKKHNHTLVLYTHSQALSLGGMVEDGETEEAEILSTCEMYNESKDEWIEISRLQEKKCNVGAACVDDHVYVFGGMDQHELCVNQIELWDGDQWKFLSFEGEWNPICDCACVLLGNRLSYLEEAMIRMKGIIVCALIWRTEK